VASDARPPPRVTPPPASSARPTPASVPELRNLHAKKKGGPLSPAEAARYRALREGFAQTLLDSQQAGLKDGLAVRQSLRIPCTMKVRLALGGRLHEGLTVDLSERGLGVLLGTALDVGATCEIEILIAKNAINAFGRIAAVAPPSIRSSLYRTSIVFDPLDARTTERLDDYIFDKTLSAFKG
jgi:hypothetical protein